MTNELKDAFEKAKRIIYEKKELMVNSLPVVHELQDGIMIKFLSKWEDSKYENVKMKKISSLDNPKEKIFLGYIPQNIKINAQTNGYSECVICLDGEMIIDLEGDIKKLSAFSKICIDSNVKYSGEALKDTYFILIGCIDCSD